MNMDVQTHHYDSGHAGPHLLITGGIHGNEVCGPKAIEWFMQAFDHDLIKITSGRVTVIPICNPKAYAENTRQYERNLNRYFYPKTDAHYYEDYLQNALAPYFDAADILLDLHSYNAGGDPFIFVNRQDEKEIAFASALGPHRFMCGFSNGYEDKSEAMGTREYIQSKGGYGVTIECGGHADPKSVDVAKAAILGGLNFLNMVRINDKLKPMIPNPRPETDIQWLQIVQTYRKECEGRFHNLSQFQAVKKGDILITFENGKTVTAPFDSIIVFPKQDSEIGEEWLYLAKPL